MHLPPASFIEAHTIPLTECGCWIWTGVVVEQGYGRLVFEFKTFRAHRFSWMIYKGPIPADLLVLHRCDVRTCVNPDHLFLGSHLDNARDKVKKGRHHIRKIGNKSKLTDAQVLEIVNPENYTQTMAYFARKFGVEYRTIKSAKHRYFSVKDKRAA